MKFFSRTFNHNRPPTESFQISDTQLSAAIWSVESARGKHRIHFKISRSVPNGDGSFTTMTIPDLLDYCRVIAVLARGFAKSPSHEHLRHKLLLLERLMMNADAAIRRNGESNEGSEDDDDAFAY